MRPKAPLTAPGKNAEAPLKAPGNSRAGTAVAGLLVVWLLAVAPAATAGMQARTGAGARQAPAPASISGTIVPVLMPSALAS